ncbi:MAG: hypothetical protein H7124_13160 [Phycisphaerales bacterium]|nr:hypothetical protein [Hyphomonadaceae bacterium]
MTQNQTPAPSRGYGLLTLGLLGALVAATGRPDEETLSTVIAWGVPETIAQAGMYVLPVVAIMLTILIGRLIGRGRSTGIRWSIYALCGAIAGFFFGLCLELFAGVPDLVVLAAGPLAEPTTIDVLLWVLTGFSIFTGVMIGVIAMFGRPAVTALQVEETDPECLEVRRAERWMFGWSAIGMLTLGLASGALVVARLAAEDARVGAVAVAMIAGVVSAIASYVLWRRFDEMQRRHVVDGYAVSAVIVTLGAFVWAGLEALNMAPALDSAGVFLALIFVQLVATTYVTSAVMGQMSMLGKPA